MASSSALCTLAGARLISSARIRFEKIGPSLVVNSPVRGLYIRVTDQIGRQKIGSKLQALKAGLDGGGDRFYGQRLGQARDAFEQDVPVGQQTEKQPVDEIFLPHDHVPDFLAQSRDPLARATALPE